MSKQQTAVRKLIEIYTEHQKSKGSLYGFTLTKKLQKELLKIEEEQLNKAWTAGCGRGVDAKTAEIFSNTYYKETYGK